MPEINRSAGLRHNCKLVEGTGSDADTAVGSEINHPGQARADLNPSLREALMGWATEQTWPAMVAPLHGWIRIRNRQTVGANHGLIPDPIFSGLRWILPVVMKRSGEVAV